MSRSRGEEWGLGNSGPRAPRLLDTAHTGVPHLCPGPGRAGAHWHPRGAIRNTADTASGERILTSETEAHRKQQGPASGRGLCVQEDGDPRAVLFTPHAPAASTGQSLLRWSKGPGPVTSTQGVRAAGDLVNAVLGATLLLSRLPSRSCWKLEGGRLGEGLRGGTTSGEK